ncbi:MAG TPA: thioredoxin domain-containing protein [Nitrososphaeraceae archaeon]|nr:thioredoxin domain-containing protein [Nitrososphaeraceae archaeon]
MENHPSYKKHGNLEPNKLISESSPYLLQHAYNPVEWYPWNENALRKAKDEDKPIFLSVGYSACHWCHVMAHESFEDEEIAKILNANFINIKVDREERPDIDEIYQKVCQLATGNGGWPLSVFLTPNQKPFYVGTYFPKHSRYGIPGFATILETLSQSYKKKKDDIDRATKEFMDSLLSTSGNLTKERFMEIEKSVLDESAINLLQLADPVHGGFGHAPKFPNTSNLLFLLRYYDYSKNSQFLNFVEFTANKISLGGLHDHVGGGFSRYSTDQRWLVPHFEKMLYDNALLVQLFSELYQITKKDEYRQLIDKTCRYVLREMTYKEDDNMCGFFSSQDADSEGEEGKFYIWKKNEIEEILKDQKIIEIFCDYFGISQGGNFEGKNILNVTKSMSSLSKKYELSLSEIERLLGDSLSMLFKYRANRVPPGKDEKILVSWNSLMISSFVSAYNVTDNLDYLDTARKTISFIEKKMTIDGYRLQHTFKDGQSKLNGYIDDYAYYINALIDYFECDSDPIYLEKAIGYTNSMISHFWDGKDKNFFFTSDDHEQLIIRTKNFYDLAVPSGNSMAAYALLRLHFITQNNDYYEKATDIIKSCYLASIQNPFGFGQLLISTYFYIKKPVEIIVLRNDKMESADTSGKTSLTSWISKQYIPNKILLVVDSSSKNYHKLLDFGIVKGKEIKIDDINKFKESVYICKDFTCSLPINKKEDLEKYVYQMKET